MPVRRCAVTRERHDTACLLRLASTPEGGLGPDPGARGGGRGVWLLATREVLERAARSGVICRRRRCRLAPDFPELAVRMQRGFCLELLGRLCRAGLAAPVSSAVAPSAVALPACFLVPADAGDEAGGMVSPSAATAPYIRFFSCTELSRVPGRANMAAVAIADGRIAREFVGACVRLARMEGASGAPEPGESVWRTCPGTPGTTARERA